MKILPLSRRPAWKSLFKDPAQALERKPPQQQLRSPMQFILLTECFSQQSSQISLALAAFHFHPTLMDSFGIGPCMTLSTLHDSPCQCLLRTHSRATPRSSGPLEPDGWSSRLGHDFANLTIGAGPQALSSIYFKMSKTSI